MKHIREYHIEYYWAEQAHKRQKAADRETIIDKALIGALALVIAAISYGAMYQFINSL